MPDVVRLEDPVLAVEHERSRLADQLHSGLMQSLVVIRHSLARGATGEPGVTPGLPTADEAVAQCLAETRRLVWHLRPRTLDAPLAHALEELAHRLSSDGGACLVVDTDAVITISDVAAALVYRVVQSVATLTSDGSALAVTVSADDAQTTVVLIGVSAGAADDAEVAGWLARASAYGVDVELVSS